MNTAKPGQDVMYESWPEILVGLGRIRDGTEKTGMCLEINKRKCCIRRMESSLLKVNSK